MAERQFGPYRLVRQIAVGGMAEIHLAKTKGIAGFEKYVALKMIHPNFAEDDQFIQMLVDEAKIAVQLTHGNIAQTFDLGRVGDTYYITMEYVDGADLYKILRRASEMDIEMPLDVCAFIGKEITSALDHAHRKRDNFGKNLGIVHRDVSPQNVLVSYSGEVKLVDFGIAKATMKARQTAVGVIKGKYYYMSPEQAWGDPIDARSDIFSAGIVLYEMITGQMLYLEEDLHKLLDMARKAEIAPPSKLRKGVPPQLERIVMHALQKVPGERYQSAGDFAADLERFLHTYSPVFTAGKISQLIKRVVGEPVQVPNSDPGIPSIEVRDGIMSTHELNAAELVIERDDIRDENSVIFRMNELKAKEAAQKPPPQPAAKKPMPIRAATRQQELDEPDTPPPAPTKKPIPSVKKPAPQKPSKPRLLDEETRQLGAVAANPNDEGSGLLTPTGERVSPGKWDATETDPGGDDLENIGERTVITGPGMVGGYMMDAADGDGPVEATLITRPPGPQDTEEGMETVSPFEEDLLTAQNPQQSQDDTADTTDRELADDDEGPTLSRDYVPRSVAQVRTSAKKAGPPPALAAKIHAPAVSEIRKPKASRRTPPGGVPVQGSVLQAIVGSQTNEPMPTPRPQEPVKLPPQHAQQVVQFATGTPGGQPQYTDNYAAPQPGAPPMMQPQMPMQPMQGLPPHLQQYGYAQGMPPQMQPQQMPYSAYPVMPGYVQGQQQPMTPAALYQLPYQQVPQQMTLTGQMRLLEVDELPSHYKLGGAKRRWITYTLRLLILAVIAGVTFVVIKRVTDKSEPDVTMGSVHIDTTPPGAEVTFDGTRMAAKTPLTIENIPAGSRHDVVITKARYQTVKDTVDVPRGGGEVNMSPQLVLVPGKLVVVTTPKDAEIRIDGQVRGKTPATLNLDIASAKQIELRITGYQPYIQDLVWPDDGKIQLNIPLKK